MYKIWNHVFLMIWMANSVLTSSSMTIRSHKLPENLVVGYPSWAQCDNSIIRAVEEGVNVLIWFSIDITTDKKSNKPKIYLRPDVHCIQSIASKLKELNLAVIHLISIGGWNAPHPDTSNPTEDIYQEFKRWNEQEVANSSLAFDGFDGIDWDVEGNDDKSSPYNIVTSECIHFMGKFSQLCKQDGYIVSMAPAESYLDPLRNEFDRILTHGYEEWNELQPSFTYHGLNTYAPLLSTKYSKTQLIKTQEWVDTFDFITIQLYEGYSHALYYIRYQHQSATSYLSKLSQKFHNGWKIQFEMDPSLNIPTQTISIPSTKLVYGLGNGWARNHKFLYLNPSELKHIYQTLSKNKMKPRGFAYWCIADEGKNGIRLTPVLHDLLQN